jgi:hypothetical protein
MNPSLSVTDIFNSSAPQEDVLGQSLVVALSLLLQWLHQFDRSANHGGRETIMADELPKDERRPLGLVEYALIIALVAVVAIGIIIVLLPAITSIIATLRGS